MTIPSIDVSSPLDQLSKQTVLTRVKSTNRRRIAVEICRVGVCARVQEPLDARPITVGNRIDERRQVNRAWARAPHRPPAVMQRSIIGRRNAFESPLPSFLRLIYWWAATPVKVTARQVGGRRTPQ